MFFCQKSSFRPLNILILNAGVLSLPHSLTEDGVEATFQINYLAHFYLVKLLQDDLVMSAPSRVVFVSSESHRFSDVCLNTISETKLSPLSSRNFVSISAYNNSKLCAILFCKKLNDLLSPFRVTCNACHPGNMVSTNLARNWWLNRLFFGFVRPFVKSAVSLVFF